MSDENTQLKDLSEMERLVLGESLNFVFNLLNNQIYHIENHDPELSELLITNEKAQEDFILLQNCREIARNLEIIIGETFKSSTIGEMISLSNPGLKLEEFFHQLYSIVVCGEEN